MHRHVDKAKKDLQHRKHPILFPVGCKDLLLLLWLELRRRLSIILQQFLLLSMQQRKYFIQFLALRLRVRKCWLVQIMWCQHARA